MYPTARDDLARAEGVARSLLELLVARGRSAESLVVPVAGRGQAVALAEALAGVSTPLVLVTSAEEH